jgi:hypothetical protein
MRDSKASLSAVSRLEAGRDQLSMSDLEELCRYHVDASVLAPRSENATHSQPKPAA